MLHTAENTPTIEQKPRAAKAVWTEPLERFRENLHGSDDFHIVNQIHSLKDLMEHLETTGTQNMKAAIIFSKMAPSMGFLVTFVDVVTLASGEDPAFTAAVWGSIGALLTLASSAGNTLGEVVKMLEELAIELPNFGYQNDIFPMSSRLEATVAELYTEVVCFYARTIHFFRGHPRALVSKAARAKLDDDFIRTERCIKRFSLRVENALAVQSEIKSAPKGQEQKHGQVEKRTKFQHIPLLRNSRFSGRSAYIKKIRDTLEPPPSHHPYQRSMALFGLGGVGKTQLALHYAYESVTKYDVVLWISADTTANIEQSFASAAQGLNLYRTSEGSQDSATAVFKVKNWLSCTTNSWLLIFDNGEDLRELTEAWPASSHGSILLTTRDFDVARNPESVLLQVEPFNNEEGSTMLLRYIDAESNREADQLEYATTLSKYLGGLPLGLSQIGGLIVERRMSLKVTLALYEGKSTAIHARKPAIHGYEHTIDTVWNASFKRLPEISTRLLQMLVFFNPDSIHEDIFIHGSQHIDGLDAGFDFLADELDFGDAEVPLFRFALVNKDRDEPILSLHRLVQSVTLDRLDEANRKMYFDAVVQLLSCGFADKWSNDVGSQIHAWERSQKCLPHIIHLESLVKRHSVRSFNGQQYAELLLRCSWYLYEREMYDIARNMVESAINSFEDKTTLAHASAIDLVGLIDLELCKPERALGPFKDALEIRKVV